MRRRAPTRLDARPALLAWYQRHRRALPWRGADDPYAIWVSEIMLQQTRVAAALPHYRRFLDRFPDVHSLAAASEEQVLAAWSGLGYYRRARDLHAGARLVVREHAGRLPSDPHALRALPGIGRYTAGAIASLAFGCAEPALDGNVRRVLARFHAVDAARLGRGAAERTLWEHARQLVAGPAPGDLNQALMELGALVCLPARPRCEACPIEGGCRAHAAGAVERYPTPEPRAVPVDARVVAGIVRHGGRVLLERRSGASPLRGAWDVPAREIDRQANAAEALAGTLGETWGLDIAPGNSLGTMTHAILERRLRIEVHAFRLRAGSIRGRPDLRWLAAGGLDDAAVSGATRKALGLQSRSASSGRGGSRRMAPPKL